MIGRRVLAPLLLLALTLGLSACGGDSGGGDSSGDVSEEQKVEQAIETALTSTDPSACREYRTIAFMEEITSSTGAEAERRCEEGVRSRENLPDAVTVSRVEVYYGKARAEVTFEGGDADGLVLNAVLVEDEGGWKIDDFTDLEGLDRVRFTAKIVEQIEMEGSGTPREIHCFGEALRQLPQAQFEEVALAGDEEAAAKIAAECELLAEAER